MVKQFLEDFEQVKEQIRSFPGCLYTEMLMDTASTGILFTYSKWNSPEDLENYRQSDLFQATWGRVKPMFAAKAEAWTLDKQVDK
jgi:quinol monooxygenase YgiN